MSAAAPLLIDAYDAALFDLDGVVYLGPVAVAGAAEGIAALRARGTRLGFVTNNAARPPAVVAAHLVELGIAASAEDVVTSAQAGADLVRDRFGAGVKVLIVGGDGVADAVAEAGLIGVWSADDAPVAVLQGYGFDLTWQQLNEAAIAIQRGAHWVATNTDPTRPTERGLVPGNGAAVAAVAMAVRRCRRSPASPTVRCSTTRWPGSAPSGRSSSATGWTPTSPARATPAWTACSCSPVRTARTTCSGLGRAIGRPTSGGICAPCSTRR